MQSVSSFQDRLISLNSTFFRLLFHFTFSEYFSKSLGTGRRKSQRTRQQKIEKEARSFWSFFISLFSSSLKRCGFTWWCFDRPSISFPKLRKRRLELRDTKDFGHNKENLVNQYHGREICVAPRGVL